MNPCPVGLFSYTIRPGDTLWLLSQRYFTTINAITAVNPGLNPNNLPVGQTICIPAGRVLRPPVPTPPSGGSTAQCPVGLRTYTIQRNDTLWLLSQRFCTTVETIIAVNPGINPNNLTVGQTIWIPAGYRLPNMPSWFRSQDTTPEDAADSNEMTYYPEDNYY
ncbi:LysM peptidoglycan-binding domain-containing protein [Clostridium sp. Marseille-P2415]|uniref:LysM peptidoglycan-binding domain-containing protein n=1 Tax=Clostridium sp. Marseille-P2415 TaxID=1805471 RepID=UPI0009889334|nr:LysM domain-containing protein [Clostridium sp. Marseille-P2415]